MGLYLLKIQGVNIITPERSYLMSNIIENQSFDMERALYGSDGLILKKCIFDGPSDGESALKECRNVKAQNCLFNLRYPFWHNDVIEIDSSDMTEFCRAALWYSSNIEITNTKLYGIKALRECSNVTMLRCDVVSPEFGWSVNNIKMEDCMVKSEYFMMRSDKLSFDNVKLDGKYSFQYINDSVFNGCDFNTKDAFWHAKNTIIRNSAIKGEYLAWYCENVTFENCKIIGTQPFCYCKGLKIVNCEMIETDLCFEKSDVEATITTPVVSIKNPALGHIYAPEVGRVICDDEKAEGEVILTKKFTC